MTEAWTPLPLDKALFANVDEEAVTGYQTAVENGFVNELGGHTRFPGLSEVADLAGSGRVYLGAFNGNLMAASGGMLFEVDRRGNVTDKTGIPISGGRRVIFAPTDRELLMAAGGPILRLRDRQTELLSANAPLTTHVFWIDNITGAIELDSGRFFHTPPGQPDVWEALDVFAADGHPDNINAAMVTPFRELLLSGASSTEQFERLVTGDVPFFRRWAIGDGVKLPYAMLFADNAVWTVNSVTELVRFSGQQSTAVSAEIGRLLEQVDDWRDAWIGGHPDSPLHILGQKFILLQAPHATTPYGTKGLTLLYDYRQKKFSTLYGWDAESGLPRRWPGWSHFSLWDRVFVGGEGRIYELDPDVHTNAGETQRWLVRTSHMSVGNQVQVKDFRLRLKRGLGSPTTEAFIMVRCRRDAGAFGPWIRRSLGKAGDNVQVREFGHFGTAYTFMFEIACADDVNVDLIKAEVKLESVGH